MVCYIKAKLLYRYLAGLYLKPSAFSLNFMVMMILLPICSFTTNSQALYGQDVIPITTFNDEELARGQPIGWKTYKGICRKIRNRIMPRLLETEGKRTLYVNANDNGSILFKPVHVEPKEYPFLSWTWKVSNILPDSREKEVGKDDYPAIVCVVYGKVFFGIPHSYKILIYAYGNNLPVGERFESPCEPRARIIIVQSGEKDVGKWLNYKVNHYQDYIREFGHEPPNIIYVGLQTNADRTHGKIEAWYFDIALRKF